MSNELLIKKKKANTLTKPVKASKPMQKTPAQKTPTQKIQAQKTPAQKTVKAPKVKPVKAQAQARPQAQTPAQAQYQNTDFKFLTSVDQSGIAIITNFRGKLIHKFLLPHTDYALFVSLHPQQKYNYVQVRVRPNSFWNDMQLVNQVILTIINVLNTLFSEANRIIAQQAHTQRRM